MKCDGVNLALDLVLEEIGAVVAQLNYEGVEAFKGSHYQVADLLSAQGKQLKEFCKKLDTLKQEWKTAIDIKTRERVKVDPVYHLQTHTKGPKQNLRVTLPNGRVIQRPTAAAALVDAIDLLGVDQVCELDLRVSGVPLVGTQKHDTYSQKALGPWLVCTHSNTAAKKALLQRIGEKLNQTLQVDLIPS